MSPDEHRAYLEALRDQLRDALAGAAENMLPQLAGQYRATLEDLSKIDAASPKVGIQDDLKARRTARRRQSRGA